MSTPHNDIKDVVKAALSTRYNMATFCTFGGLGGVADLLFDVFPHGNALTVVAVIGVTAVGVRKFFFADGTD